MSDNISLDVMGKALPESLIIRDGAEQVDLPDFKICLVCAREPRAPFLLYEKSRVGIPHKAGLDLHVGINFFRLLTGRPKENLNLRIEVVAPDQPGFKTGRTAMTAIWDALDHPEVTVKSATISII
ncbi:TPA: hypothetical protein U2T46_000883 [Burkholderia cenocepacia]|nr:hypothetical protein [Burkholderia cenocepacia]